MYFTVDEFRKGIYAIDSKENKNRYLNKIKTLIKNECSEIYSILFKHELTNLAYFFKTYYQYIKTEDYINYRTKLLNNDKYLRKESELTLVLVCKTNEHNKSEIYAKLLVSLLREIITMDEYIELLLLVDTVLFKDLEVLHKVGLHYNNLISDSEYSSLLRLKGAGLANEIIIDSGEIGKEPEITFQNWILSDIGKKLDDSLYSINENI